MKKYYYVNVGDIANQMYRLRGVYSMAEAKEAALGYMDDGDYIVCADENTPRESAFNGEYEWIQDDQEGVETVYLSHVYEDDELRPGWYWLDCDGNYEHV